MSGLSLLQRTALAELSNSKKILVVTEENCPDSCAFASYLPSTRIETDPGSLLLDLDTGFKQGKYDIVFGLTRDSNYVLIEQYAQASSYQLRYEGRHQYNSGGLSHTLRANENVVNELTRQINRKADAWSQIITRVPVLSNHSAQKLISTVLQSKSACPKQSPGQLVSWLFKRDFS
jgi:hypothetical protein